MADAKHVVKKIKDDEIKFVDLRFTDPRGKMQHVTMDSKLMDEEAFTDGIMFDGSSIAGWKVINESDMKLMPDPSSAVLDPFFAQSTLAIFCDTLEPLTNEPYERDPRSIAGKAQAYLQQTGVGDVAVFGPEAEFFVFDDVRFAVEPFNCGYKIDSAELPINTGTEYEMGNLGHRPRTKGGYFPVPPVDSAQDLRSEMLSVMSDMGVVTEKHHHEVGAAQHELGIKFG
jgi:glutamine synthetase